MNSRAEPDEGRFPSGRPFRAEEFSFRFTKLTPASAERLRNSLAGFQIESRRPDVVALVIDATTDIRPICAFVESEALEAGTYSIWASVVTSTDHGGVSLPAFVLDLARRTGAGIDFSFVACLDEADDEVT